MLATAETDIDALLARTGLLERENERLTRVNALLAEEIRLLKHHIFGRKSERGPADHPELFAVEPSPAPEPEAVRVPAHERKVRNHPGRHAFPEHLPVEVVEIPLPESERPCPDCGAQRRRIDVEVTRELEVVPAKLFVREYHRETCACPVCQGQIATAPAPSRPIEKGIAGPGLIAQIIADKYADHLPLYRQEKRFAREGVILTRQTLSGIVGQVFPYVVRIVDTMKADLLAGGYIQADEVPVPVQDRRRPGSNAKGWLWAYARPGGPVVFDFRTSRARAGPVEFLKGFKGDLQHDGYGAYSHVPDVVHAGCMAHARRGFWKARKGGARRADKVLGAIRRIYAVERGAREAGLDAEARLALRRRKSVWRMDLLRRRIEGLSAGALPQSALGKACAYALSRWAALCRFLENGRIEIDNNLVENAIRPVTLGRKNWMHIGHEDAGPWTACYASLCETCRRLGINPWEYFQDVLSRIADHPANRVAELAPAAWKKARDEAAARAAQSAG